MFKWIKRLVRQTHSQNPLMCASCGYNLLGTILSFDIGRLLIKRFEHSNGYPEYPFRWRWEQREHKQCSECGNNFTVQDLEYFFALKVQALGQSALLELRDPYVTRRERIPLRRPHVSNSVDEALTRLKTEIAEYFFGVPLKAEDPKWALVETAYQAICASVNCYRGQAGVDAMWTWLREDFISRVDCEEFEPPLDFDKISNEFWAYQLLITNSGALADPEFRKSAERFVVQAETMREKLVELTFRDPFGGAIPPLPPT